MRVVPLAQLPPGALAVVEHVDGDTAMGRRLIDLGFVPQTRIRVVRRAPLGDPCEYALRGSRICLRRAEAERVRVCRLDAPSGKRGAADTR